MDYFIISLNKLSDILRIGYSEFLAFNSVFLSHNVSRATHSHDSNSCTQYIELLDK
ncbi:MAG: hypothetical protein Q8S84_04225 [bacterium]|nr:hypothetical protein [bacterium]